MNLTMLKKILGGSFLLTLIFAFNVNLLALDSFPGEGDKEQAAAELTQSLSAQVQLTEDQISQIKDILVSYQEDVENVNRAAAEAETEEAPMTGMAELDNNTNEQILAVLDETQRPAYEEIQAQFWEEIRSKVSETPVHEKETQEEETQEEVY